MTGVANGQVVDDTRYLVGQFQVGINIEMTTHANSQRIWGNTHLIEVELLEIGAQRTIKTGGRQQGIEVDCSFQQEVATDEIGMCLTIANQCMSGNVIDIQLAITDMVNLCICNKAGTRREEVGTLSLGSNIGRNSIDAVTRHEVMHVQITYLDISIIAHSGSMERTLSLYHSLALVGSDVGKILLTIGLHTSLCRQRRYAIVALHITWQHSHHEAQVLGVGLELHVSTQLIGSIEIGGKPCRCGVESGRQRYL